MPIEPTPILVVEDNLDVRTLLERVLVRLGYAPTLVASGAAGLQALENARYALLLTDLNLPDIAGGDLIRQARLLPYCPPIILMSGASYDQAERALGGESRVSLLPKPFSIAALRDILARALTPRRLAA